MIWFLLVLIVAGICLYVCAPLLSGRQRIDSTDTALEDYQQKITELDTLIEAATDDQDELIAAKTALQRKTLEHANTPDIGSAGPSKALVFPIIAAFSISAFAMYAQLGAPELINKQASVENELEGLPIDQLVVRLEDSLKADPSNPNGWVLYARSLVSLGRFDDALAAYERALALTNRDEKIAEERTSAIRYIDQVRRNATTATPGPSAEDMEAAAAMTADDRAAMIQNMVDGLSAKLLENPMDENGWVRLISARKVLGQMDLRDAEIVRMKEAFAGQPETIEKILSASGLDNP